MPERSEKAAAASAAASVLQRRLRLSEMLDLPSFSEVCKGFADLYKVGVKVFEEGGDKLVDIREGSIEFCSYVYGFPNGRALCTRTALRAKEGPVEVKPSGRGGPAGVFPIPCFAGCRYLVMPIFLDGDLLGRAIFGPFVPEELRELPASVAATLGQGFQVGQGLEFLRRMRRAPEHAIAKITGHFASVVDALVYAGQKVLLTDELHIEATREAYRQIEAKNRELTQVNERMRELDRLKSNFLATVSHELRTPLTSIIGYSEMLSQGLAGPLNPEQDDYVRTILEKGESLLSLIRSILDVTQIEAGRLRLAFAPCDVNDLARQALSSVAPQAQRKGLQLDSALAPGMSRPSIDREKVRQCLVNLLANAVKFTPSGGRVLLGVLTDAPEGMLANGRPGFALVVEDSGIGIDRANFGRIFETFFQVDSSSTREYGGAGLGLAIVKSFVEAHEGTVRLESEVGRGSRFTLALPYAPRMQETEIDAPF